MARNPDPRPLPTTAAGFALPSVLVVVGALLILALGILIVTGVERNTARSFADLRKAELAARAAVEEVEAILLRDATNDDFIVFESKLGDDSNNPLPAASQLFLARGKVEGNGYKYSYTPLFSAGTVPEPGILKPPTPESLFGTSYAEFSPLPTMEPVRAAWVPVRDATNKIVARYAYWIEDLQGRIDAKTAGNERGASMTHARTGFPFPAPGLNPEPDSGHLLDEVALYAVDPEAKESKQGDLAKNLKENQNMLLSPGSILAAAGFTPPLDRGTNGLLTDPAAAAAESSLSAVRNHPYLERAVIPFALGIQPNMAGQPKLNLNKLLADDRGKALAEMASHINSALPEFTTRKGGFPDDYLKTLAANALDYADDDSTPTVVAGVRGLDSYPLVSEFLMTFRWERIGTVKGRKVLVLSASTYVELWNMTDHDVAGQAKVSYETGYTFKLGADPNGISLGDMANAEPKLESEDGRYWFPPFDVSLRPNEYKVYTCGTLTFTYDLGGSSVFVLEPLILSGDGYGRSGSGYRLKWKDPSMDAFAMVDQSRGAIHRNDSNLYYNEKNKQQRKSTRCTIPSHSHTVSVNNWRNNMGDPRMSFYNTSPQDANAYPENYSPNRRNVRLRIYRGNNGTSTIYARVMPSEWPDGGHNSEFGSSLFYTEDDNIEADDNRFFTSVPNPIAEEAPMRVSNLGRFFSATEIGRAYDPIMWNVAPPATKNGPWGDVETTTDSSSEYGGGNSLRIGRPEHPEFRLSSSPGKEAWRLLDLFHAGQPFSEDVAEREGDLIQIDGHVNLNTATRDTLRALAIGALQMDPAIEYRTSDTHNTTTKMAPPTSTYKATDSQIVTEANTIADAIIEARKTKPFSSAAEVASVMGEVATGRIEPVFGNLKLVTDRDKVQRSDSASEELFARVYESGTVRSRNFRIWVIAQTITPTASEPAVLAEVRRCYTVFQDPGERNSNGTTIPGNCRLVTTHENNF